MKPCPFCGKEVDLDDPDTLHPNGFGWKDRNGIISYHSFRDVPKEQWCYSLKCVITSGGCGAEISADSKQEAIDKWNTRMLNDKNIAGAIFDFAGYLTTREKVIEVGESANPLPMAYLIKEWAALRGLAIEVADIWNWDNE